MAALLIDSVSQGTIDLRVASAQTLKDWLAGDWAVLLSDAEDFAPHPTTPPSYLARLSCEFMDRDTRLLTLAAPQWRRDESWIPTMSGDTALVTIGETRAGDCTDLATHALRSQVARLERPFALALDSSGRIRLTLQYIRSAERQTRSVAEVLHMIDALKPDTVHASNAATSSVREVSGW